MDIETGERVEGELNAYIAKRDKQRRQTESERRLEALWVESVRRHNARQEADHRAAWHDYEMRLYRIHSGLAAEHLARAARLEANGHHDEATGGGGR